MNASVYAIVLNWNGWPDTVRCLASLWASRYPALHVVVVDNGSTDGSADRLVEHLNPSKQYLPGSRATRQPGNAATSGTERSGGTQELEEPSNPGTIWAELLCLERNRGFTGGANAGLRLALERGADYAFLLNNDATVDPSCIGTLVGAAQEYPDVGLAGPRIVWAHDPGRIWSAGMSVAWSRARVEAHRDETDDGRFDQRRPVQGLSACALLVKRGVLERVGLLDERYFAYYEDLDWCLRARRAGLRCLYVGDARALHAGSASANRDAGRSQAALVNYYAARNGLLFMATHAPPAERPLAVGCLVGRLLAAEARVLAGGLLLRRTGAARRAAAIAAGVADAARGRFGPRDGTG